VIKGKSLESETLRQQPTSNTKEQFATCCESYLMPIPGDFSRFPLTSRAIQCLTAVLALNQKNRRFEIDLQSLLNSD